MKHLLLHACCAPCSPHILRQLKQEYFVTVFFYNPNIHGRDEYELRLKEIRRLCIDNRVPLIEGRYDPARFFSLASPLADTGEGGERCLSCFRLRLGETVRVAKMLGTLPNRGPTINDYAQPHQRRQQNHYGTEQIGYQRNAKGRGPAAYLQHLNAVSPNQHQQFQAYNKPNYPAPQAQISPEGWFVFG